MHKYNYNLFFFFFFFYRPAITGKEMLLTHRTLTYKHSFPVMPMQIQSSIQLYLALFVVSNYESSTGTTISVLGRVMRRLMGILSFLLMFYLGQKFL